jgi:uncharacterized SAM-binding protein YcdF (DUF218 family)
VRAKVFGAGRPTLSRRRARAVLLLLGALALLAVAAHRPALRAIGRLLVVEETPPPADAIVVVAGRTPSREARAAALFREGRAPRVLVSRQFMPERARELVAMGIRTHDFQGESVLALEKFGVPRAAIVTLDEPVEITETELRGVAAAAKARGWRRVTLVTSALHARRVKTIWSREAGTGVEAGIAVVEDVCSRSEAWWRRRRCSEAVLHEYLGLLALYLHISSLMR